MSSTLNSSAARVLPLAAVVGLVLVVVAGGLWLVRGNDSVDPRGDAPGSVSGDDPYLNAVSDERAPVMTVTLRDHDGQPVADITYDASGRRVPLRGTYAFLQTRSEGNWSTEYTLSDNHGIIEGVPEDFDEDANVGPGPDTYRVPNLNAADTYRICVSFVLGHPSADAPGCSAPFRSS
jgi:hypothetical protein